ncbi:replication termination factor 2, partial [Phenoliferia sp. Uapishka_3]
SCPLGRLYNKDAILTHLLSSPPSSTPFGSDGLLVASHIRSLRDLTTLQLTPNPALLTQSIEEAESSSNIGTRESYTASAFVCPLSLRICLEEGVKAEKEGGEEVAEGGKVCPVSGAEEGKEQYVTIYPVGEEKEKMELEWANIVANEKELKKAAKEAKKRKSTSTNNDYDDATTKSSKKVKSADPKIPPPQPAPSIGSSGATVPKLSATLAAKIAEAKKSQSKAVASLYAPKDDGTNKDKDGRSNWMTRGAFTRYA